MKLAYIIQTHRGEKQLISLINRLSDKDTDIFFHIDKKNEPLYLNLYKKYLNNTNVYFVKDRESVNWSAYSMVRATLKLMNMVKDTGRKYDYISFISGQDYPIKSNDYIRAFLTKNQGKEFMEFRDIKGYFWRLKCYSFFRENPKNRKFYMRVLDNIIRYPQKLLVRRNNFKNMNLYSGSAWTTLTYDCLLYILKYLEHNPQFEDQFKYTSCSDEHFFQMIVINSSFKERVVNNNLRYTDWSGGGSSPKTLTSEDYDKLVDSDKLYARKFNIDQDENIIKMLNERFLNEK